MKLEELRGFLMSYTDFLEKTVWSQLSKLFFRNCAIEWSGCSKKRSSRTTSWNREIPFCLISTNLTPPFWGVGFCFFWGAACLVQFPPLLQFLLIGASFVRVSCDEDTWPWKRVFVSIPEREWSCGAELYRERRLTWIGECQGVQAFSRQSRL